MRILLLMAMMIFASSAFAGLYKWVDDEGNVHYSQKRPINQQSQRLEAPPPAPEDNKPLYKSDKPTNTQSKAEADIAAKNEVIRVENCAKAKTRLTNYQIYRRIRDTDGNITVVDDKVRAQQIEKAKESIEKYCN